MAEISKAVIDTLIAEAGGEGDIGLIAAAWAIQQRAAARGQTIDQVVRSGFDGFTNPGPAARKSQQDPAMRARVEQIMRGVSNGSIPNPVQGADHFLSGDVMPSWAKQMRHVATINGHRFYASGNVPRSAYGVPMPPEDLPQVASALDVVPPRQPPTPNTISPDLSAIRQNNAALDVLRSASMGTPQSDVYAGIFAQPAPRTIPAMPMAAPQSYAGQEGGRMPPRLPGPVSTADLISGPGIRDSVNGAMNAQPQALASALDAYVQRQALAAAPRVVPPMPMGVAQSYAGQDRAPAPVKSQTQRLADLASLYAGGGPTRPPTDQIGIANTGRPMLSNPDGSFSTELSMTVTDPRMNSGAPTNVPTIWGGRRLSDEQAMNTALASGQKFQAFPTIAAAEAAARYRSANEIAGAPQIKTPPVPASPSTVLQTMRTASAAQNPQTAAGLASWLAGNKTQAAATLPPIGPTGGPALNPAPSPASQSDAMRVARAPGQTVAVIPTVSAPASSGIGQAPKTTVVKSVPANTALAPKPTMPSDNITVARNPQAPATTVATIPTKTAAGVVPPTLKTSSLSRDSVANTAAGNATVAGLANKAPTPLGTLTAQAPVYQPSNPTVKTQDRLPAGPGGMPMAPASGLSVAPKIQVVPNPVASTYVASKVAPTPLPASARPLQVATMLDTVPPQMRNVAHPRPRPGIVAGAPMGGPVFQFGPAIVPQPQQRPAQSILNQILGFGFAPINQQQVAQSAAAGLLNPASFAALSSGSHSYVSSDGAVMPTTSMSGKVRNTYGD